MCVAALCSHQGAAAAHGVFELSTACLHSCGCSGNVQLLENGATVHMSVIVVFCCDKFENFISINAWS